MLGKQWNSIWHDKKRQTWKGFVNCQVGYDI
jgi:hypothetical protein